jgi:hypothetical protein
VYYVSFIDDFSRNTRIYFLRKKSEVFDKFKEFKALVENQTEKKIKVLRTNNGGEFCENEFEEEEDMSQDTGRGRGHVPCSIC